MLLIAELVTNSRFPSYVRCIMFAWTNPCAVSSSLIRSGSEMSQAWTSLPAMQLT